MLKIICFLTALAGVAYAQEADKYWQQLVAGQQAQCSQSLVNLAKALDETKLKLDQANKELEKLRAADQKGK